MSTPIPTFTPDQIAFWRVHPGAFVEQVFRAKPDAWQEKVLEEAPHFQRVALRAAKGVGKSTVLAWLGWHFLVCYPDARVYAVSASEQQLRDTLFPELVTWGQRSAQILAAFDIHKLRIESKERPGTWFLSGRAFARSADKSQQASTLQGIHGSNILLLLDEAGAIPSPVLTTADGICTGGSNQRLVIAGNTNDPDSALGKACLNEPMHWKQTRVTGDPDDPMRSPRQDRDYALKLRMTEGPDSPFYLVNVMAEFPAGGIRALIDPDTVRAAMQRAPAAGRERDYDTFAAILGVDGARDGMDESVACLRRGKWVQQIFRLGRDLNSLQGAVHVNRLAAEHRVVSIQIDATGGWGGGWLDQLQVLGCQIALPVKFSGQADDSSRFFNKRAEMYWRLRDWLLEGDSILPQVFEMVKGLSSMEYGLRGDRIIIETKDNIRNKIGRSPDLEDALACTFAFKVAQQPAYMPGLPLLPGAHRAACDYDPYDPDSLAAARRGPDRQINDWDPVTHRWRSQG